MEKVYLVNVTRGLVEYSRQPSEIKERFYKKKEKATRVGIPLPAISMLAALFRG